jgi:hypothetical protein
MDEVDAISFLFSPLFSLLLLSVNSFQLIISSSYSTCHSSLLTSLSSLALSDLISSHLIRVSFRSLISHIIAGDIFIFFRCLSFISLLASGVAHKIAGHAWTWVFGYFGERRLAKVWASRRSKY